MIMSSRLLQFVITIGYFWLFVLSVPFAFTLCFSSWLWEILPRERKLSSRSVLSATQSRRGASTRWAPTSGDCSDARPDRQRASRTQTPTRVKVSSLVVKWGFQEPSTLNLHWRALLPAVDIKIFNILCAIITTNWNITKMLLEWIWSKAETITRSHISLLTVYLTKCNFLHLGLLLITAVIN